MEFAPNGGPPTPRAAHPLFPTTERDPYATGNGYKVKHNCIMSTRGCGRGHVHCSILTFFLTLALRLIGFI